MITYLVTVNRNVKYSTQIAVETETDDEAKELALDLVHSQQDFPDPFSWEVNEDSGLFVSHLEPSVEVPVNRELVK